jgi:molybdate transport system ATP-binding protein
MNVVAAGLEARMVVHRGDSFTLDLDISLEPGTTAALLGPNGSGKSTMVAALAGLLPLDEGAIKLDDRILDDPGAEVFVPAEQRRVGVVFQRYLLFDHLDVIDNVAFGPEAAGRSRREARTVAGHWIDLLDLGPLATTKPRRLSGGQAQRVALARALAADPAVLLLDEPLAALDVATRAHLRRVLKDHLATYSGPRLLITHDPADAFLLANQIHVIENGRLTQSGTINVIRRRPATPYVAALAGLNLLTGNNEGGSLTLDNHDHRLQSADTSTNGPVLVTIHPNAVALHSEEPHGSPRNSWPTTIAAIEPLGDITRVMLGRPLPLSVDVTPGAVDAMGLTVGTQVWASVKATEINVNRA